MAVAFDAKATADTAGHLPASPITNAGLTIGATATALVAYASIGTTSGTQPTISAMTWNGVAMTLLGSKVASDALNSLYVFGLANPATGNHTLSATISGSTANSDIYLDCASFTGTETSSTAACFPSGNVLTDASTQSGTVYPTTAFSVTTVSGDMALAAMANQAVAFTGVAAGTLLRSHAPNIGQCTWGYNPAVGASTSEQFTGGTSGSPSAGVAIRIVQPAAAAPFTSYNFSGSFPVQRFAAPQQAYNVALYSVPGVPPPLMGQVWMEWPGEPSKAPPGQVSGGLVGLVAARPDRRLPLQLGLVGSLMDEVWAVDLLGREVESVVVRSPEGLPHGLILPCDAEAGLPATAKNKKTAPDSSRTVPDIAQKKFVSLVG